MDLGYERLFDFFFNISPHKKVDLSYLYLLVPKKEACLPSTWRNRIN